MLRLVCTIPTVCRYSKGADSVCDVRILDIVSNDTIVDCALWLPLVLLKIQPMHRHGGFGEDNSQKEHSP